MGTQEAMFETIANTQQLTNFLGKGFEYKDCSADYKKGVSFTPEYCNIMNPPEFLKKYGDKTVPQKIDAKYVSSNKGNQWIDYLKSSVEESTTPFRWVGL